MISTIPVRVAQFCIGWLFLLALVGCQQPAVTDTPEIDPTHERLMKIGLAYREFTDANQRPPAKPEELGPLLKAGGNDESVWVSQRDHQPFVVIWNVDLRQPPTWATSTPVFAYEAKGKDGRRLVRTTAGSVEELSAEQFAAASFPPGHTPTP